MCDDDVNEEDLDYYCMDCGYGNTETGERAVCDSCVNV